MSGRLYRAQVKVGELIGSAICAPKLLLGRRRHNNRCDRCGEVCLRYGAEKLDFPLDDLSPEATTSLEKIRAMLNAEYKLFCLECAVAIEAESEAGQEVDP